MPVETATYINQLNSSDPLHTDAIGQADSHLRLIKATLQNSFHAFTGAAVTATEADLNTIHGFISVANGSATVQAPSPTLPAPNAAQGGSVVLAGQTNQTDVRLVNAGSSFLVQSGNAAGGTSTTWTTLSTLATSGNLTLLGTVSATDLLRGVNSLLPIGVICEWYGSVATIPGGWHLCDGTTVGGYTTPNLKDKFIIHADGTDYAPGATGGALSHSAVTDTQGGHSHGGADAVAGPWGMSAWTDVQGYHAHTGATTSTGLTVDQLPPHVHQQYASGSYPGYGSPEGGVNNAVGPGFPTDMNTGSTGSGNGHLHGIYGDGNHAHNVGVSNVPAHQHGISVDGYHAHNVTVNTVPPYYALCYIMRVA